MDSYPQHTLILRKLGSGLGSGKDYPIIPNLNPYPNPNSNPNPDRESAERRNHPPSDPFGGPVDLWTCPRVRFRPWRICSESHGVCRFPTDLGEPSADSADSARSPMESARTKARRPTQILPYKKLCDYML